MKGLQTTTELILWLVAGFFTQRISTATAVFTMNQTCAQLAKCHIADPSSCDSFGFCENGQLKGTGKCPEGYAYNSRTAYCEIPTHETCTVANVASICQYAPDQSLIADPDNCNRFCKCNNKVAECNHCPTKQVFDSNLAKCAWSHQSTSKCRAESICRLVPDGIFAGDPDHCDQYLTCNNGVGTPGQCAKSTYYNKEIAMCQYENPCQNPTPTGIGLGVAMPLAGNAAVCKGLKGPFPKYVTDSKTCMGFYACNSTDGPGTWDKCPMGLHFNNGTCVTPYTFGCAYDRCANINQMFVGAIESGCHNYLICGNQTSQGQSAGYLNYAGFRCNNNQYFNEYTQTCDENSPASSNYKLCP